ncbi:MULTISPECIES: hypothetical protein [unclassified Halomonas]|uniref:hypothetical protein n=1 Tax=unclassified Halomonas TaxID=2609666 RepID=UPI0021E36EE7|nr:MULTISPECIES: hypothetical protein [unclassified Halomonas]UYF99532.1 hypothetical protein OCT39_15075 [Halomonas sp. GD1P12]WNL39366.1 hypothetical protein RN346_02115 [Halomonas sp. PAMB 3232]WNL42718.1 hypothetical protein RN347_02160 [Halomonas sp. PAMB 3264]
MAQNDFYTRMRAGLAALLRQWRSLGQADADQLALILAETARVAKLGTPDATPSGRDLERWSDDTEGTMPLWAPRTAVFLLNQMPARPTPQSDEEACAWAYCWLKNRAFDSQEAARAALPAHLQAPLEQALDAAWRDQQGLRLI